MNTKSLIMVIALIFSSTFTVYAEEQEPSAGENELSAEEQQYMEWAEGIWNSLDRQTGEIKLSNAVATLNVPEGFYFLNATDAEKVLVDVWGNPPGQSTLGMLFPADMTPFDETSWAVTIEYEEDGYVSDEDADEIDYQDMLADMQSDVALANEERVAQGYEPVSLIGSNQYFLNAPFHLISPKYISAFPG